MIVVAELVERLLNVCFFLIIINLSYLVDADQAYDTYVHIRPGQVPTRGFFKLSMAPRSEQTNSIYECAGLCVNANVNNGTCGGFIYQPDSCDDGSGSPTKSGECQLGQFFNLDLLLFAPANTMCQTFYASQAPPDPSKKDVPNVLWRKDVYNVADFNISRVSPAVNADVSTSTCVNGSWLHPWWLVDMTTLRDIQVVQVWNPNNQARATTLDYFMVGLTNTMPSLGQSLTAGVDFDVCGQYNDTLARGANVGVVCPKPPTNVRYMYLILMGMLDYNATLCVNEIQAF